MNNISNQQSDIVNAFIKNEQLLSKLYSNYALQPANDKDFWNHISHDETVHASWVCEFSAKMEQGLAHFDENRFKIEALNAFSDYINVQIARTESEEISLIQSLSISMDLESSMLERGLFEVFESDDIELRNLLDKLRTSTETHFAQVKIRWDNERNRARIVQ